MKDILDFLVVFMKIIIELLTSTVKLFISDEQKDVSGEIVLITGAGHGIGRQLTLQYAELGSTVVCIDINENNNAETAREANLLNKGNVYCYKCDITNRDEVLSLGKKVLTEVGYVSILVNNAGIMPSHSIEQHTPEEIRKLFDVNVLAHFWVLEAFLPHMKAKSRGHIVAISSIAGVVGLSNLVPYCATKFAVRGLMEALSEELREAGMFNMIRTTTIYPYMVNTGLCKRPKVKFPSILGLLDPKYVATSIIAAQKSNLREATVPRALLGINAFFRILPLNCALLLKDYIDSGVGSDL